MKLPSCKVLLVLLASLAMSGVLSAGCLDVTPYPILDAGAVDACDGGAADGGCLESDAAPGDDGGG